MPEGSESYRWKSMREISPALNMNIQDYLKLNPDLIPFVDKIRKEKSLHTRPYPSKNFIDKGSILTPGFRKMLLDKVSELVDENLTGRSDMCQQFALLITKGLNKIGLSSLSVAGTAIYYDEGKEIFRWDHTWVVAGEEVIDGNVDILYENPLVPKNVCVYPYWGGLNKYLMIEN